MGLDFYTGKLSEAINWARKFSLFQYPFVTACCGMEFMAVWAPRYDIGRFGAEFPRFSPRQSDVLFVVGTITLKQAPVVRKVYEQMCDPKWVVAFGVCACSGGFYDNYTTVPGVDKVIPVDVYIPGCPPRPEQVLDGLVMLQERIQAGLGKNQQELAKLRENPLIVMPREGQGPALPQGAPAAGLSLEPQRDPGWKVAEERAAGR